MNILGICLTQNIPDPRIKIKTARLDWIKEFIYREHSIGHRKPRNTSIA
jgi:hypothetical protein